MTIHLHKFYNMYTIYVYTIDDEFKKRIPLFIRLTHSYPESSFGYYGLGKVLLSIKEYKKAEEVLRRGTLNRRVSYLPLVRISAIMHFSADIKTNQLVITLN